MARYDVNFGFPKMGKVEDRNSGFNLTVEIDEEILEQYYDEDDAEYFNGPNAQLMNCFHNLFNEIEGVDDGGYIVPGATFTFFPGEISSVGKIDDGD